MFPGLMSRCTMPFSLRWFMPATAERGRAAGGAGLGSESVPTADRATGKAEQRWAKGDGGVPRAWAWRVHGEPLRNREMVALAP